MAQQQLTRALAQVEWQIVMRLCDRPSLLALARCSQSTLSAASSDFAWAALSPVMLNSSLDLAANLSSSLLRFADIGVIWVHNRTGSAMREPPPPREEEIAALAAVPRLRLLDARSRYKIRAQHLLKLLLMPNDPLKSLATLFLGPSTFDADVLRTLAERCETLTTLHAQYRDHTLPAQAAMVVQRALMDALAILLAAHGGRLTHLNLNMNAGADALQPLMRTAAPNLTRLTLAELDAHAWQTMLTAPVMHSIEQLALKGVGTKEHLLLLQMKLPLSIDWTSAFANLRSLRELTLDRVANVDSALRALATHAPASLRSLHFHFRVLCSMAAAPPDSPRDVAAVGTLVLRYSASGSTAPSASLLASLLDRRPDVCSLTVHAQTILEKQRPRKETAGAEAAARVKVEEEAEWTRMQQEYEALQRSHPNRMQLLLQ